MKLEETSWFGRGERSSELQFCVRLLDVATAADDEQDFLGNQLPEMAAELQAQWVGLVRKMPEWEVTASFGRQPVTDWPWRQIEETLDTGAARFLPADESLDASIIAVPLKQSQTGAAELLLLAGRSLSADALESSVLAGWAIGLALRGLRKLAGSVRHANRLQATLQIASKLSHERETEPLLELIAEEATRLLESDRASIFIWDRDRSEVIACPALGVKGGSLRLPDNAGIVGEVIQRGKSICVDDAYQDSRFNQEVDRESGYRTRNLLCVPLIDSEGDRIGAFELINKRNGSFTADDEEGLTELGIQAATAIRNTQDREQLVRSHQHLTEQASEGVQIIGESPAIAALSATIDRLAGTDLPVLILGESGTGKEVVSQSLHYRGSRRDRPFIAVNCAALTETLLESELFGHEKGAFTDAHETRQGKFELAEGGTLFLDEIGDMSGGGQAKLLRVLEQKVVTRVGGSQVIPIDVRVIAATNQSLSKLVSERKFREDLYYRLGVVTLDLPPLRERPEDVIPLAEHFLRQFAIQAGRPKLKLSAEAKRRLQAHLWPGNVRELRNLMERVAFLCPGDRVEATDLAFMLSPDRAGSDVEFADKPLAEATRRFQQDFIRRSIRRVKGNMSEAARVLGLHRSNLYRKMHQLEMHEAGEGEEE